MSGTRDKLEGKAKEIGGKAIGDRELESKGKGQHTVGAVKDAADEVAEEVTDKVKDLKNRVAGSRGQQ